MKNKKLVIGITAPSSVVLIKGQLSYFRKLGYSTYLIGPKSDLVENFCREERCMFIPINIKRDISVFYDMITLLQIIIVLGKLKPDIVNLGTPKISLLGMVASYILKVEKRIYTCRGFRFEHEKGLKRYILKFIEKIIARLSHKIICISNSVLQLGLDESIFSKEKAIVINYGSSNGIDLKLFKKENIEFESLRQLKEQHGLESKFIFGFIGRLIDRKGIKELYEAFSNLSKEYPNICLLIIGPIETNQVSNEDLINKYKWNENILLLGKINQEKLPKYIALMDVFVLPSWWEGFGNVLIQAASMGKAVISTNATGTKDAVKDGYNGILVSPKNSLELLSAMESMLKDDNLRHRFGINGETWVKNFDRESLWNEMHIIYNK